MAVMILPSHIWPKVQNTLKFVVQILDHLQTKQHISTRFVQFQDGLQILLKKKVWPNLLRQIAGMKFHIVRYVVLYPRVQVRLLGIYYFGGTFQIWHQFFFFFFHASGSNIAWKLYVDEQESVQPTTAYGPPEILQIKPSSVDHGTGARTVGNSTVDVVTGGGVSFFYSFYFLF